MLYALYEKHEYLCNSLKQNIDCKRYVQKVKVRLAIADKRINV